MKCAGKVFSLLGSNSQSVSHHSRPYVGIQSTHFPAYTIVFNGCISILVRNMDFGWIYASLSRGILMDIFLWSRGRRLRGHFPMQKSLNIVSKMSSTSIRPVILPIAWAAYLSSSAASTMSLSAV